MLSRWRGLSIMLAIGGLLLLVGYRATNGRQSGAPNIRIVSNNQTIVAELAASPAARDKGLGGRSGLAANRAMLFQFEREGQRCFWMKDMRFDIDMIWLSADKSITALEARVSPRTYPASFCHWGQYVIEVAAGRAAAAGWRPGDKLAF